MIETNDSRNEATSVRKTLQNAKKIVIKIGTSTLVYPNGTINLHAIDELAFVLAALSNQGKEIILVSSGAIGVGMNSLHLSERPASIPEQQAVAAVGQGELMNIYSHRFRTYKQQTAQMLLTRDIIEFPASRQNVTNTLEQLLKMNILPIINENDTVSVDELDHLTKFGDNDLLSSIVAELCQADLLIMLSDVDGFFSSNPIQNPQATLFSEIHSIDESLYQISTGKGSKFGSGGMYSKLKAAERLLQANSKMVLANGQNPKIIFDILNGKKVGTLFTSIKEKEESR